MKYISFDLEIFDEFDPEGDLPSISCASTRIWDTEDDTTLDSLWFAGMNGDGPEARPMNEDELAPLIKQLQSGVPVTWNGTKFDFPVLGFHSGQDATCKALARHHIDMLFQFHCIKGYPVSLDSVCKAMQIPGKYKELEGKFAPAMWRGDLYKLGELGFPEIYRDMSLLELRYLTLDYVMQDSVSTMDVFIQSAKRRSIKWITRKGKVSVCPIDHWRSVVSCLELPVPDTSWMDNGGISRESFIKYILEAQ